MNSFLMSVNSHASPFTDDGSSVLQYSQLLNPSSTPSRLKGVAVIETTRRTHWT